MNGAPRLAMAVGASAGLHLVALCGALVLLRWPTSSPPVSEPAAPVSRVTMTRVSLVAHAASATRGDEPQHVEDPARGATASQAHPGRPPPAHRAAARPERSAGDDAFDDETAGAESLGGNALGDPPADELQGILGRGAGTGLAGLGLGPGVELGQGPGLRAPAELAATEGATGASDVTPQVHARLAAAAQACYPAAARRSRQTGRVGLSFCVNSTGAPERVTVQPSGRSLLDEAAERCVLARAAPFDTGAWGRCFEVAVDFEP